MRITLTLDDDVADALRERAALLKLPFRRVVNDALRRELYPTQKDRPAFRVKPLSSRFRPGIDPTRLNQLSDELEARRLNQLSDELEARRIDDVAAGPIG